MTDEAFIRDKLNNFTKDELFEFVMDNPEYMTDNYYADFRRAIYLRYEIVKQIKLPEGWDLDIPVS